MIEMVTKTHFPVEGQKEANLEKKYLLFYIVHELMFKSLEQPGSGDKFAYVRAVGDNLSTWIASLVLHQGETDYFRL